MTKTQTQNHIPEFKNISEEAEFWDTHDFTDYPGDFRPVKIQFSKELSQKLAIRLDTQTLTAVQEEANRKGIGPSTFVRMLIKQYFHTGQGRVSAA